MSASNIIAAFGAKASAFGPKAGTSIFHILSVTDSKHTMRVLKQHTQLPPEPGSLFAQRPSPYSIRL